MKVLQELVWLTQLGISLATPPLAMLLLCGALERRLGLGAWVSVAGLVIGLLTTAAMARSFYRQIKQRQEREEKPPRGRSFREHQ